MVLIQSVERAEGVPIADTTSVDDLCADLSITQMNHLPMRRAIQTLSSIFSTIAAESGISNLLVRNKLA